MGVGGAEGVGLSANVFVNMVEAPLFVRPYLSFMTRSELFALMTCGMATIAGTVMVLYAMCGFANSGSLGIMIGGMGTMAPDRRNEIVELGPRSVIAGTISTCMTGAVVGIIGVIT